MFTGIIQDIGIVKNIENLSGDRIFTIESHLDADSFYIGASVCHSGCCLTLIEKQKQGEISHWKVQVSNETINLTTLGDWQIGTKINLEPSLKMGDEIGGHLVTGHVDGKGIISNIESDAESKRITVTVSEELMKFIAKKGSIAIDGVSLTVNEVTNESFCVNIIPHTLEKTTIGSLLLGKIVNLELDPLARYAARWLSFK